MTITFVVFGKPMTQGSTRTVPVKDGKGGFRKRPDGRLMLIPIHDKGKELKAWRQEVASAARKAYSGPLLIGAVAVVFIFERPRPKGHYGTGRNAGTIKASAPSHPTTKPDTVKLARAVEDALTGVLWGDDAQVCGHELYKSWGDCYRLSVTVEALESQAPLLAQGSTSQADDSKSASRDEERHAAPAIEQSPEG